MMSENQHKLHRLTASGARSASSKSAGGPGCQAVEEPQRLFVSVSIDPACKDHAAIVLRVPGRGGAAATLCARWTPFLSSRSFS